MYDQDQQGDKFMPFHRARYLESIWRQWASQGFCSKSLPALCVESFVFQIWSQDWSESKHAQGATERHDQLDWWQLRVQHQGELGQRHEELWEWDPDHGGWHYPGHATSQQDESASSQRPCTSSTDQAQPGENVSTGWPENKSESCLSSHGHPLLQMAQLSGIVSKNASKLNIRWWKDKWLQCLKFNFIYDSSVRSPTETIGRMVRMVFHKIWSPLSYCIYMTLIRKVIWLDICGCSLSQLLPGWGQLAEFIWSYKQISQWQVDIKA